MISKSRTIRVDGQHLTGEWYGEDACILKTNGHWQAVEVEIEGKGDERTGKSSMLIGYPQKSPKECRGIVNQWRAGRVMVQSTHGE